MLCRFKDIVKGAALIAGVDYELEQTSDFYNKIPVLKLNELLWKMQNWQVLQDWHHQEKTGSTDFGNVMWRDPQVPCIRVAFVPKVHLPILRNL